MKASKPTRSSASAVPSALLSGTSRHVACDLCRERKVRCSGGLPSCIACTEKGNQCVYTTLRGLDLTNDKVAETIKMLTARLAEAQNEIADQKSRAAAADCGASSSARSHASTSTSASRSSIDRPPSENRTPLTSPGLTDNTPSSSSSSMHEAVDVEAISSSVADDLHESFFENLHSAFPIPERARYMTFWRSLFNRNRGGRALVCAIWMHGASSHPAHSALESQFYQQCRRQLEQAEASDGDSLLALDTAQACLLLALYEFKNMHFARAWLNHARALRLVQILQLEQLDRGAIIGLPWSDSIPDHAADSCEHRHTFWVAYILDRLTGAGTDWGMTFDDAKVLTFLPTQAPHHTHVMGSEVPLAFTPDVFGDITLPATCNFAAVVNVVHLWGRCMLHVRAGQVSCAQGYADVSVPQDFWMRHVEIEAAVTRASATYCSPHLSVDQPISEPNNLFIQLLLRTMLIYTYQAAIAYVGIFGQPAGSAPNFVADSESRCQTMAMEISSIARYSMMPTVTSQINFMAARTLHAAAQVLLQTIQTLRGDAHTLDALHSLMAKMGIYKRSNPLVELYVKHISDALEGRQSPDPTLVP